MTYFSLLKIYMKMTHVTPHHHLTNLSLPSRLGPPPRRCRPRPAPPRHAALALPAAPLQGAPSPRRGPRRPPAPAPPQRGPSSPEDGHGGRRQDPGVPAEERHGRHLPGARRGHGRAPRREAEAVAFAGTCWNWWVLLLLLLFRENGRWGKPGVATWWF